MSNLPPGVSASSIPGNSKDDIDFENAVEELSNYSPLVAAHVLRTVMPLVEKIGGEEYRNGLAAGREENDDERRRLLDVIQDLVDWGDLLGGWEAPCWARAKKALRTR